MPINIISDFAPAAGVDIPVTNAIYIKGGYYEVADITARNAIASVYRIIGMVVRITSENRYYRLNTGITNSDWTLDNNVTYTHTQGIAASSWFIPHNLGYNPNILTIDPSGVNIIGSISFPSGGITARVDFNRTTTGSGFCN